MISDAEIAVARSMLPHILPMPLKREGNLLVGPCPFHNDETPSFKVYPDWHYHCFGCGVTGNAMSWLRRTKGLTSAEAVRELIGGWQPSGTRTQPLGSSRAESCTRDRRTGDFVNLGSGKSIEASDTARRVQELWRTATSPRIAQFYLETRGIAQKALPEALRGHLRVWCNESGRHRPAMLAAVTDSTGRITAIQRIWTEDRLVYDGETNHDKGARAADLEAPKKTLGTMGAGAVRLAAAGEVLGLAEGNESALAAAKLFRLPVWATCGATRLGSIQLPECVRHVVIFGDNDANGAGRREAAKAEAIYRRRGYSAQSEFPETDWCAVLARG